MKTLQKYKNTLAVILLLILVFLVYKFFFQSEPVAGGLTINGDVSTIGQDLVETYVSLQRVTMDQSLFNSPMYRSLTDFGVSISNQPMGRSNPFDLIGRD